MTIQKRPEVRRGGLRGPRFGRFPNTRHGVCAVERLEALCPNAAGARYSLPVRVVNAAPALPPIDIRTSAGAATRATAASPYGRGQ
jgi:hypothetical protein